MEEVLNQRLKRAEATSRAILNAKDSVNFDGFDPRLSQSARTPDVRQVTAERDELRNRVRIAIAELHKVRPALSFLPLSPPPSPPSSRVFLCLSTQIEVACGGPNRDVEITCQQEMEKMARLRAQVR